MKFLEMTTKVEVKDGKTTYYSNHGLKHRDAGPAVIQKNRDEEWWINGVLTKTWSPSKKILKTFKNGKLHSFYDEPSVHNSTVDKDYKIWHRHGKIHREVGPARIEGNEWQYYKDGKLHRERGPAIVRWANSGDRTHKTWYINGKKHREDGPALIRYGQELWFFDGKKHRNDGPAVVNDIDKRTGTNYQYQWWWKDRRYSSLNGWLEAADFDDDVKVLLKLQWG